MYPPHWYASMVPPMSGGVSYHHHHHYYHGMGAMGMPPVTSFGGTVPNSAQREEDTGFMIGRDKLFKAGGVMKLDEHCISSPSLSKNCSSPRRVYSPRPLLSGYVNTMTAPAMSPSHR